RAIQVKVRACCSTKSFMKRINEDLPDPSGPSMARTSFLPEWLDGELIGDGGEGAGVVAGVSLMGVNWTRQGGHSTHCWSWLKETSSFWLQRGQMTTAMVLPFQGPRALP